MQLSNAPHQLSLTHEPCYSGFSHLLYLQTFPFAMQGMPPVSPGASLPTNHEGMYSESLLPTLIQVILYLSHSVLMSLQFPPGLKHSILNETA